MSWSWALLMCFISSQAAIMALLSTSGLYSELFGRHRRNARAADTNALLRLDDSEWVDTHEFWELGKVEEVAF